MNKIYTITEYGSFVTKKDVLGTVCIPQKTFDALENFILSGSSGDSDAFDFFGISARRGVGKIITVHNYVGMIALTDGTVIEILPKVYSRDEETIPRTKRLLVDMLRTLRTAPYKSMQTASVDTAKLGIFEIFIRMFVNEVFLIVKHGLKSDYASVQDNENYFKGKLLVAKHILANYAHKERCFVEYDDYNVNRPENRIIKAALLYLSKNTTSAKNKSDIKTLLNCFEQVEVSSDYESDFAACRQDRNMKDYETALIWSRVFLQGRSFTSYTGSQIALVLLFPMETLFESYIAEKLRRAFDRSLYRVSAQDRTYHLFDIPARRFLMKPDVVITRKSDKATFILDTKWKILAEEKHNFGISQADMYQMYAYQKKYSAVDVRLVYPMTNRLKPESEISYTSNDGTTVRVVFVDMYNVDECISNIVTSVGED